MWIGSERSRRIHHEDCEYGQAITHEREEFSELHHALSRGYQEAICCLTEKPRAQMPPPRIFRKKGERCLVCGTRRVVQAAHVIPQSMGGAITIPLCPNHHWLYDEGLLSKGELQLLCERAGNWVSLIKTMHGAVQRQRTKAQPSA